MSPQGERAEPPWEGLQAWARGQPPPSWGGGGTGPHPTVPVEAGDSVALQPVSPAQEESGVSGLFLALTWGLLCCRCGCGGHGLRGRARRSQAPSSSSVQTLVGGGGYREAAAGPWRVVFPPGSVVLSWEPGPEGPLLSLKTEQGTQKEMGDPRGPGGPGDGRSGVPLGRAPSLGQRSPPGGRAQAGGSGGRQGHLGLGNGSGEAEAQVCEGPQSCEGGDAGLAESKTLDPQWAGGAESSQSWWSCLVGPLGGTCSCHIWGQLPGPG